MKRFKVIQEQTVNDSFTSTIANKEAITFLNLNFEEQYDYLQENFFAKDHEEGARNLLHLAEAIKEFGSENVDSYTILICG